MARYIDADELYKKIFPLDVVDKRRYSINAKAVAEAIVGMPTADVAPRAEVDELIYKLECLLCHATGGKLSKYTYDLKTMETVVTDYINESYSEGVEDGYKDGAAEVAMEIFEEIASKQITIVDHVGTMGVVVLLQDIFELKKKYTEAETEPPKGV